MNAGDELDLIGTEAFFEELEEEEDTIETITPEEGEFVGSNHLRCNYDIG